MAVLDMMKKDYEFAQKYSLDIIQVINSDNVNLEKEAYTKDGVAINSDFLDGLLPEAKAKMIDFLEDKDHGKKKNKF